MAIDANTVVDAGFLARWLTVGQLVAILAQLDNDYLVRPNQVGNLSIFTDGDRQVGYIDFAEERLEVFDD